MDWTDIIIEIKSEHIEIAAAIAQMVINRGIYIEDYSDFDIEIQKFGPVEIIDSELLSKDRTVAKLHIYFSPEENPMEGLAFLKERFEQENIPYVLDSTTIKESDWANNWKKYFKPCPIGEKLLIVPSWETKNVPIELSENRKSLIIDPGMAFGSGQHETTRLCMELIEKYTVPGAKVLDVGTGSGILAISALLLGAGCAMGIDIDALSVKVATENAALNGVKENFIPKHGDLAKDVEETFDLITANIVADIVIALTPDAVKLLNPTGTYIMSGIIEERKDDVLSVLDNLGFEIIDCKIDKGWCALAARHK
ncbi:MAG: 50S ribosomal protein L11 methyltransferase [Ruminococcaceae bacterium]|nr:50S ribosomal protein L11 methyltransferase [Oscillospiraceae bacterium]